MPGLGVGCKNKTKKQRSKTGLRTLKPAKQGGLPLPFCLPQDIPCPFSPGSSALA